MSVRHRLCAVPVVLVALLSAHCLARPQRVADPVTTWRVEFDEEKALRRVQISPDGRVILTQSNASGHDDDSAVRLFDGRTLRLLWQRRAYWARLDPRGRHVAAMNYLARPDRVEVRTARTGQLVASFEHSGAFAFAGPGKLALVRKGRIDIVDYRWRTTVRSLRISDGVWGEVQDLEFSADGARLAYLGVVRGKSAPACPAVGPRQRVIWSPYIAGKPPSTGGHCGRVVEQPRARVVDVRSGRVLCSASFDPGSQGWCTGGFFSRDGKFIALGQYVGKSLVHVDDCRLTVQVTCLVGGIFGARDLWVASNGRKLSLFQLGIHRGRSTSRATIPLTRRMRLFAITPDLSRIAAISADDRNPEKTIELMWMGLLARPTSAKMAHTPERKSARTPGAYRWLSCDGSSNPKSPKSGKAGTPELPWPGAPGRSAGKIVDIRATLTHSGVVLRITNRSPRTIAVDWHRTFLVGPQGRRLDATSLSRKHAIRCADGPPRFLPTQIPPGSRHVEELVTLRRRSYKGLREDLLDPTPRCGRSTTLHVGIITGQRTCATRTISFSGVCPSAHTVAPEGVGGHGHGHGHGRQLRSASPVSG